MPALSEKPLETLVDLAAQHAARLVREEAEADFETQMRVARIALAARGDTYDARV